MLSDESWGRNVGTDNYPVSFLHEYAVGLIWDMLAIRNDGRYESSSEKTKGGRRENDGQVQLPILDGQLSGNVLEGVDKVVIPDSLQPIGGYIPDLALLDSNGKVLRVIEVVTTSAPPSAKVASLEERGVEVIQVPVRCEDDLKALFPEPPSGFPFWHQMRTGYNSRQHQANQAIDAFMLQLVKASPSKRREFVQFLGSLTTLESLYPLREDNSKAAVVAVPNPPDEVDGTA